MVIVDGLILRPEEHEAFGGGPQNEHKRPWGALEQDRDCP